MQDPGVGPRRGLVAHFKHVDGVHQGRVLDRGIPCGQRVEKAAQRDSLGCVSIPPGPEFSLQVGQSTPSRTPHVRHRLLTDATSSMNEIGITPEELFER